MKANRCESCGAPCAGHCDYCGTGHKPDSTTIPMVTEYNYTKTDMQRLVTELEEQARCRGLITLRQV